MPGSNFFTKLSSTVSIAFTDANKLAVFARCTGAPPTTANTFAHGCIMIREDSGTGNHALYENVGSSAVPSWDLIGAISATEISLSEGNLLIGNASGVATSLNAKTSGRILVGDGTTLASVAMSGDATIVAGGALTIANGAVTPAKQSTAARTRVLQATISPLPAPTGADQLNIDRRIFQLGQAGSVVAARVISATATAGSDATNQYQFVLRNSTTSVNFGASTTNTNGSELSADTAKSLTIDQNQTFAANDVLVLRTSILDDGGAGPTDLSSALIRVEIEFTI